MDKKVVCANFAHTTEEIPNALIEQYEIDGHKLMEIIDELEEVEAV